MSLLHALLSVVLFHTTSARSVSSKARRPVPVNTLHQSTLVSKGFAIHKRFPLGVHEQCLQPGTVTLTFDDGITRKMAEQVLPWLARHKLPATFFVIGETIDPAYWDYRNTVAAVEMAAAAGHEIGNHSRTHPDLTTLSVDQMREEVVAGSEAIKAVIGVKPRLFRPPMGHVSEQLMRVLKEEGMEAVGWNINSEDWMGQPKMVLPNVLMEMDKARPVPVRLRQASLAKGGAEAFGAGFIMLLHEPQFDVEVMEGVLAAIKSNKLRVVSMQECLGIKPYHYN